MNDLNFNVGDGATIVGYSDLHACTVISAKGKTVIVQRDKATRLTDPEFVVGGFSAHCTNNREIEYSFERDLNGSTKTYTKRKNGRWVVKGSDMNSSDRIGLGRREFYDYNF